MRWRVIARRRFSGRPAAGAFLANSALMRITVTLAAMLLLFGAACNQKTETQTTTDAAGNVQQTKTTTVTATVPSVDTTATAEAKQDVKDAANTVANTASDAAHATGTAMEKAGKKIQKKSGCAIATSLGDVPRQQPCAKREHTAHHNLQRFARHAITPSGFGSGSGARSRLL